jgi:hypothetical protein
MKKTSCSSIKGITLGVTACLLLAGQVVRADFIFGEPTMVPNINSNSSDSGPQISHDGLELYFHSGRKPVAGEAHYNLWVSKRSTTEDPWSEPVKLNAPLNSDWSEASPSISADGLELYFADIWPGFDPWWGYSGNPHAYGFNDMWVSTRASRDDAWGPPENLGPLVNSECVDDAPCISADGLSLYFHSERPGCRENPSNTDIFVTTRLTKDDPWGKPVKLGSNVNGDWYEYSAEVSPDGLALFFARGLSTTDMYVCRRTTTTAPWGWAELFAPVNSEKTEFGLSICQEDSTIYFARGNSMMTYDWNIWQVKVTPIMDINGDGTVDTLDISELRDHWGNTVNSLYDIAPIPFGDGVVDNKDLRVLREYVSPELATKPHPASESYGIPKDTVLSWESGEFAQTHDVYFGTDFDDVNNSNVTDLPYMGRRESSSFDPGKLDFGQTYYWCVDEVNGAPDFSVFKGDVWSFTVEPVGIPIANITATASSSSASDLGPKNTINGSGLNGLQHSTEATDMWLSAASDPKPSIQYEFDKPYKLHEMWVWNSNQLIEPFAGVGAKDVVIEYSTDGIAWMILEDTPLFAQAPGNANYTANTTVEFSGTLAKLVRITINAGYGILPQSGLSEVRFLHIPTYARDPRPVDATTVKAGDVVLNWKAGREADLHQVYLGTNAEDLLMLGTTDELSYDVGALDYDTTYYWQIVEVNESETPASHAGDIWSFTTPAFGIVDNFDQYDNNCNRLFFAWEDGLGHNGDEAVNGCDVAPFAGNGSGSAVGHNQAPFTEMTIVNADSRQSMPFAYDNASGPSEATLTLAGQDWTTSGIQTLTLFFHGQASRRRNRQFFVKVNNTKVVYSGEGADLTQEQWQQWSIDLTSMDGLENVTTLTIGVEGDAAAGMLYIDDIRLYP